LIPPDGGLRILNPERDARFVGIAQNEQMLALATGSVQAAMLTPPFDSMREKEGFRRLVFVGDVFDYPQGGLAATDKKIQCSSKRCSGS